MSAPGISLAPGITASEYAVVLLLPRKKPGNLEFTQRAQHTEVVCAPLQVCGLIIMEIFLKLKAFGILVVDRASLDRALVGTGFVGQGHHGQAMHPGCYNAGKCHQRGKRRMPIQISLTVKLQHVGIQGALCAYDMGRVQARHLGGVYGGPSGIDNIGADGLSCQTQKLQRHRGILSSAYGDQDAVTLPICFHTTFLMPLFILVCAGIFKLAHALSLMLANAPDIHKMIGIRFLYTVHIEKFTQSVKIQILPPVNLVLVQPSGFHCHYRRAGYFPVAYQLHHSQGKYHVLHKPVF